jgi:hypothetical protein
VSEEKKHPVTREQEIVVSAVEVTEVGTKLEQAISVLFKPGQLVEVRGKKIGGGIASKYYTDHEHMVCVIEKANSTEKYEALWVTLQRVKPGTEKTRTDEKSTTGNNDIEAYEWLVIDIDRPKGDPYKKSWNATDEELATLRDAAVSVVDWLTEQGFPEPVFACSGNGYHVLYKLGSLPTSFFETLHNVLKAVAHQFRGESATFDVDTSLADPCQIIKMYGTMSRKSPKGSSGGSRPWRESYIGTVPQKIEVVSGALLERVASMAPQQVKSKRSSDGVLNPDFDPYDFFEWGGEYTPLVHKYEKEGMTHFVMGNCCLSTEDGLHQHHGDRRKSEFILGDTFGYHCFSDDCDGKGIGDVLRKLRQLKGEGYPKRIWVDDDEEFDVEAVGDDDLADAIEIPTCPSGNHEAQSTKEVITSLPQEAAKGLKVEALAPEPNGLDFPEDAMYGRMGEMARQMWMPLGLAFPALLGCYSILPDFDTILNTRINLYVALIAHVGGGKNVAMERARKMLNLGKMGDRWEPLTAASDRGLMNAIGDRTGKKKSDPRVPGPSKMLLMTNEMSEMLKKASIDKSTLAGTLCDLWDQNEKKIADRNGVQSCDCRVSWIGGVPVAKERPEEFAEIFGSETARGLLSRIILGYSATKFNYKHWEPPAHEISVASEGDYDFTSHIEAPNVSRMSGGAQQIYDAWQTAADASGRLKYNLMKIALLTASCNKDAEVKPEGMAAAIRFMQWQVRLREVFKPSVALDTAEAKFAEQAMQTFIRKGGQERPINWKRIANDRKWGDRYGDRLVANGIKWMIETGRICAIEESDDKDPSGKKTKKSKHLIRVRVFKKEGSDGSTA